MPTATKPVTKRDTTGGKNRGEFDRGFDSGIYGEHTHGYDRDNYDPYMDDAADDW